MTSWCSGSTAEPSFRRRLPSGPRAVSPGRRFAIGLAEPLALVSGTDDDVQLAGFESELEALSSTLALPSWDGGCEAALPAGPPLWLLGLVALSRRGAVAAGPPAEPLELRSNQNELR